MKRFSIWIRVPAALALALFLLPGRASGEEIVYPTCTQDGYILARHPDGTVTARRGMKAPGHSFGPWTFDEGTGAGSHTCLICGAEERVDVKREGLPRLFLTEGAGTEAVLEGSACDFACKARLVPEDTGDKEARAFTLYLLSDGGQETPLEHTFPGWLTSDRYTLTSCRADPTAARGLAAAALWRQAAASRPSLPERLKTLPLLGGTDGFAVTLWRDGAFDGLYILSPKADGALFGMYRDENTAVAAAAGRQQDTMFRAGTTLRPEDGGWVLRWQGAGPGQPAGSRLSQLLRHVAESDDATLHNTLYRYLDVDGAVDVMLLTYALGLTEYSVPLMLYYGEQWIPVMCGTENAFGAEAGGLSFRDVSAALPRRMKEGWSSGTDNLLFDRLLNVFEDRAAARWQALRETVLDEENILSVIDGLMGQVPPAAQALDALRAPGRLTAQEERDRIAAYLRGRLPLLDAAFGGN